MPSVRNHASRNRKTQELRAATHEALPAEEPAALVAGSIKWLMVPYLAYPGVHSLGSPMGRVYILGGGGSGKTTLARLLGERLGYPAIHLDDAYASTRQDAASEAERRVRWEAWIAGLLQQPSWVVEGNFPGWIDELADRADAVVWLDVPFRVAAWRILKRHLLRHG